MNDAAADRVAELGRVRSVVERHVLLPEWITQRSPLYNWILTEIARCIVQWREIKPDVEPYRDRLRQMVKIADKLSKALTRVPIEAAGIELAKISEDGGYSAESHLRAVIMHLVQAKETLAAWNRQHRPGRGAPQEFDVDLTFNIWWSLRNLAGLSDDEIENKVLASLIGRDGLPELTIDTLKRREARRKEAKRGRSAGQF